MTFDQILVAAKAAKAPPHQITFIELLNELNKEVWLKTGGVCGRTSRELKTHLIRLKLERWLTALETNYHPAKYWGGLESYCSPLIGWTQHAINKLKDQA